MREMRGRLARVLVAGATGYLGCRIVSQLQADGYWVRALVRRPEQAAGLPCAPRSSDGQRDIHGRSDKPRFPDWHC